MQRIRTGFIHCVGEGFNSTDKSGRINGGINGITKWKIINKRKYKRELYYIGSYQLEFIYCFSV